MKTREETDSLGTVEVPEERLWGAQTQRALDNFRIGWQKFPLPFIHRYALLKKACAEANLALGKLDEKRAGLIGAACDEIIAGGHDDEFPLPVWQTGSGTQCNMNLNEVIANRANEMAGGRRGAKAPVHPNDHVNLSQSSNDTFPTVMHLAAVAALDEQLLPALERLLAALDIKAGAFAGRLKSGRTHLMDATPVTLGQEFGAWRAQLGHGRDQLRAALPALSRLAIGGSAVGTGLNTHPDWVVTVVERIAALSGHPFEAAANRFAALAGHEAVRDAHGALAGLATSLFKMASDLRLMASGPRCGLAEIRLPANEPGSSIMPGKVNPTQIEALTMVCARVLGNDTTLAFANSQGQFQLNVFKPVMIYTLLESIRLLGDAVDSFRAHCLEGIEANDAALDRYVENTLMLVTALNPHIGYDNAARAARYAFERDCSLEDAVVALELLSAEEYRHLVVPGDMLAPR